MRCPFPCGSLSIRLAAGPWQLRRRLGGSAEIRGIEIIFSGNADQGEKRIPPGIGEGGSHSLRRGDIGHRAYRPFRGDPFTGRMRKNGRKAKEVGLFIDFGRLDSRDLMPAKALADNIQPARQRGIAEGAVGFTRGRAIG